MDLTTTLLLVIPKALLVDLRYITAIWTDEESMDLPAARDLLFLPLPLKPHQALRQKDQNAKGRRMSYARYVRIYILPIETESPY